MKRRSSNQIIKNKSQQTRCQWLMPVILAAQEAEIRKTETQTQPLPQK
jgi:hypothetical protein